MLDNFTGIDDAQKKLLIDAIAQITVLIAGADGIIDTAETAWATKLTKIRSYASEELLNEFYQNVGKTFTEDLNAKILALPKETDPRTSVLVEELTLLNEPLAKLPNPIGAALYESYTSFAKHVAEASGGFLRMWSVSGEEKKLMSLPMLTPIELIIEEDEA